MVSTLWHQAIRILNGCEVRIENSVTRVTVRHHEACRVMPNSYPSDGIFNSHLTTIMDSFSCIHFLRKLYLNFYMRYYINITLKCLHFRSRHDRFGFYLLRWRWNIWRKMTSKSDVMTSKLTCDVKKTHWRHARESSYTTRVRRHFLLRMQHLLECFSRTTTLWDWVGIYTWRNCYQRKSLFSRKKNKSFNIFLKPKPTPNSKKSLPGVQTFD